MEKMRSTVMGSLKLLGLVCQHLAAPLVSFAFSCASAFAIMFFAEVLHLGQRGFMLGLGIVAFCGVIMGARCLPPATRRFGSIGLPLLGLFFFYRYIGVWGSEFVDGEMVDASRRSFGQLIFLAIGGLTAVIVIWWLSYLERELLKREHLKKSEPFKDSKFTC